MPDEFSPGVLARVREERHADNGLGGIGSGERGLLADFAVARTGVDRIDHDPLLALFLELALQQPRVRVNSHLQKDKKSKRTKKTDIRLLSTNVGWLTLETV